jgi:hypothetical protein
VTIPASVRTRYEIGGSELAIDTLLWAQPSRIALLDRVAQTALDAFGEETRLTLSTVWKLVDIDTKTVDPDGPKLMIRIATALRDTALQRAIEAFRTQQGEACAREAILWHTRPGSGRLGPERIEKTLDEHRRRDA